MPEAVDYAFMHGGGQGSWIWHETIAALRTQDAARTGRVLTLNAPGCGEKRTRDTQGLDLDAVVDELLADIDRAKLRDVVLVGHSQGGTVLPMLARRAPDRFRRLVYVSCIAPTTGRTTLETMGTGLRGTNPDEVGWPVERTDDHRAFYAEIFCNDMAAAQAAAFLDRLGPDQWPSGVYPYRDWRYDTAHGVPATYVVCLKDRSLPAAWQETFAQRYGVDRLVRLDAGHQAMNTRPHALAEILRHEAGAD